MKSVQRSLFKFNPIATAIALVFAAQFPVQVAQANSGFGDGVDLANAPIKLPTFNANSPSGPTPTLTPVLNPPDPLKPAGMVTLDPTTKLPVKASSGKALRKFVDTLPGLYIPGVTKTHNVRINGANKQVPITANNLGQYIPVAVPEKWVDLNGKTTADDYIEIAAVEYSEKMHSDLLKPTRLRGYVQLMTPGLLAKGVVAKSFKTPDGQLLSVVDLPHHLGPVINSTTGTALRVKFVNKLPIGGKLFLPVDTTVTGAGTGPDGTTPYSQNRAVLHLVGGGLPWISAGTPHQWIAPAGETNPGVNALGEDVPVMDARGVSNNNVPDMADPGPGATTLYFPNDASARFMFYHDRTSGLTRLNSYAGMEAGYFVTDATEQALIAAGHIPGAADTLPLIIEDKTFVPADIAQQDAKWNKDLAGAALAQPVWGGESDLWFPHVYEANQDPNSAVGTNPVGRFDYGPLFWPIFPAFDPTPTGSVDDPTIVPTAYFDTPIVNGTAYPTVTVDPKAYRFRILNASVDRYLNLGLYKADTTPGIAPQLDLNGNPIYSSAGVQQFFTGTEVKLVPALAADAAGNPPLPVSADFAYDPACLCQYPGLPQNNNVASSGPARAWPIDARRGGVPDPTTVGPDIIAIGNDGGFLPNPVDIPSQPITYEVNKRSITVNNAYGYGLLLGPAERSDAIIDFSKYAGQTLIVYNDAPAPFPFSDERNDYYTGNPDLTSVGGAYATKGGYGPNTRTIMQIKVNAAAAGVTPKAFDPAPLLNALPAAYAATQPAPLVPAVAYNKAFGTNNPDIFAHIATGAATQPTLDFTTTGGGAMTLTGLKLITSGGLVNGNTIVANAGSGSGYDPLNPPKVVFNNTVNGASCLDPVSGVSASATATVDAFHQVNGITNFNPGSGYTCLPTVSFVNAAAVSTIGVLNSGSGYTNPVVTIAGEGTGATATATVGSIPSAAALTVVGGSGYSAPTVTVTGGGVAAGSVLGKATVGSSPATVTVNSAGSGYVLPTVAYSGVGPGGTTLTGSGTFTLDATQGIATIALDPAVAFVSAPSISIIETDLNATVTPAIVTATVDPIAGTVTGVTLAPNAGFTSAPSIAIVDATGNGASATATVSAILGTITGITVTNPGTGYTVAPTVTIAEGPLGGPGTGATAIAGLAPTLGVGAQVAVQATGGQAQSLKILPLAEQELFDNRGRYNFTGGVEMPFTNAINQTTVPLNYIDAATEAIADGETQVWKITVNGLFSNNLSFNLADVQLINRVGWDGTVKPPSSNEVGWKNNVRMNPLEDVLVAVRANSAKVPFGQPQSSRAQDPSKKVGALGSEMGFTVGQGVPQLTGRTNRQMAYDNEFFWNSSMLSNSENDFMRPIVFTPKVVVPDAPTNVSDPLGDGTLTWTDPTPVGQVASAPGVLPAVAATLANPQNEIGFKILQASLDADGVTWSYTPFLVNGVEATVPANATRWTQPAANVGNTAFAVVAYNAAGQSGPSTPFADAIPTAPTTFTAAATAYNAVALSWSGNTTNNSIQILRDAVLINTLPGTATNYVDATVSALTSYNYTINVTNNLGTASATANPSPVTTPMIPVAAPTIVSTVTNTAGTSVALRWTDNANNETAYWVDVTVNGVSTRTVIVSSAAQGIQTNRTLTTNIATAPGSLYTLTVTAVNVTGGGTSKSAPATAVVDLTPPVVSTAPTLTLTSQTSTRANLSWNVVVVPASAVSYVVQVSTNGGAFVDLLTTTQTTTRANVVAGNSYKFQVLAKATRFGLTALGNVSAPALDVTTAPAASAGLQAIAAGTGTSAITLNWTNPSSNIVSWTVARRPNFGLTASRVYSPISVNMQGASPSYTFTDKVPNLGSYTYRVTAVNPQGTSPVATSNAATAQ